MGFKKGHQINTGRKRSDGTKEKISKTMEGNTNGFKKGHKINVGIKRSDETREKIGKYRKDKVMSKETKEKLRTCSDRHHIWYEDNGGNSTDKGIMIVSHAHHRGIHAVLRHNLWTDNRRYLAG